MATWAQLLANLRLDLKDAAATKKWSDETLLLYVRDAIYDYSSYFPLQKDEVALAAVDGAYTLPADYVQTIHVQCPKNRFLELRQERPGARYPTPSTPMTYFIAGGKIYLDHAPLDGVSVYLTYAAVHPVPSGTGDTTWNSTYPARDEELIRLYVKAKAHEQTRSRQANLDRFKLGSGSRDDNPLAPEVGNLLEEYYAKIAERFPGGAVQLWRPGRIR
jgi:hypothetical protein